MNVEMGEYLVGAYLEIVKKCDVVSYNVKPSGTGFKTLGELDVIGLNFKTKTAWLCEVATHILGFGYGNSSNESVKRVGKKFSRQKEYAKERLKDFKIKHFQFWSPRVSPAIISKLSLIKGLESVINKNYTDKIGELRIEASKLTKGVNNPAFRLLQILEHMKKC